MPIKSSLTEPPFKRRQAGFFVALVVFFASVYMLTYSGHIASGASLRLFDAISSQVNFGDLWLDESMWFIPPSTFWSSLPYPLRELGVTEQLQNALATPLYLLADAVPGFGLVHTVWLFNIIVAALAGGTVFLYALALGYNERTAVLSALVFGLGTIIWPYSKTFFREPLALLLLLVTALLAEHWRARRYRSFWLPVGIAFALLGAVSTKKTAVFALPALLVVMLPQIALLREHRRFRPVMIGGILLFLAVPLFLVLTGLPIDGLLRWDHYYNPFSDELETFTQVALHSYLFSIGGSVWGTSPIILLAVTGLWMLARRGHWRYVWVVALAVLGWAMCSPFVSEHNWFGGLSWPPRFLVPIIPFAVIGALPVLDRLTRRPWSFRFIGAAAVLMLYSLWVQFTAVSLDWAIYPQILPPESNGVVEWLPGMNAVQYLRWVLLPAQWSSLGLDFVWMRAGVPLWVMIFAALAGLSSVALWLHLRERAPRRRVFLIAALPVLLLVCTGAGLRLIYDSDGRYLGENVALHDMLDIIGAETHTGDVVLLANNTYERFILNYNKLDNPRFITLPIQPGERLGASEAPEVESDNPDLLLTTVTIPVIRHLAEKRDRLWLLAHNGPFIEWSVRPVERFMAAHFYPIREIQTNPPDPNVRLIEFSTISTPNPYAFMGAENLSDLRFGDSIRLLGYTLPSGTTYAPGDVLPVAFYWQSDAPPDVDYSVVWLLVDADNVPVVQGLSDPQPGWGFAPTSGWQPGIPVWDNRAIRLPSDLPPGEYRMWLALYLVGNPAERLPVTVGDSVDGNVGVLPVVIEVELP